MQRTNKLSYLIMGMAAIVVLNSCDKTKTYKVTEAPPAVHFATQSNVLPYYVTNSATSTYTVKIGTTDVSDQDRTVTYKITSPTGAVAGTHYTTPGTTVTIPAGQATAEFTIHGIFAQYATGRKDTLVLTLDKPSVEIADFADTVKLVLQRYCDVVFTAFAGDFDNTREYEVVPGPVSWGPYTTTVTNPTTTSATTGTATLENIFDYGGSVIATFNWTDPANFTVTIAQQNTGAIVISGGTPYQLFIRSSAGALNTFSSCDGDITLSIDALAYTMAGALAGTFAVNYRVVMKR